MTTRLPAVAAAVALLSLLAGCGGDWGDVGHREQSVAAPPGSAEPLQLRPVRGSEFAPAGCYVRPTDARPSGDRCRFDDIECDRPVRVAPDRPMGACQPAGTGPDGVPTPEIRYALGPALAVGGVVEASAGWVPDGGGSWVVALELAGESEQALVEFSQRAELGEQGDTLALVVDGQVVLAPWFSQPLADGSLQISGDYTQDRAQRLAATLIAGG